MTRDSPDGGELDRDSSLVLPITCLVGCGGLDRQGVPQSGGLIRQGWRRVNERAMGEDKGMVRPWGRVLRGATRIVVMFVIGHRIHWRVAEVLGRGGGEIVPQPGVHAAASRGKPAVGRQGGIGRV